MAADDRGDARHATILTDLAYSTYLTRRLRQEVFEPKLFGEPAWDILLLLYSYPDDTAQLGVTDLARELQMTPSLVERWVKLLVGYGLVTKSGGEAKLTSEGRDKLATYLKRQIGSLMQMLESVAVSTPSYRTRDKA